MSEHVTYVVCLVLVGRHHYLLWHEVEDSADEFVIVPETSMVLSANSSAELLSLAADQGLSVSDKDAHFVDIDTMRKVLSNLRPSKRLPQKSAEILLECWNALEDLAHTLKIDFLPEVYDAPLVDLIYNKLFSGNNLPAVIGNEKPMHPIFSPQELACLRAILRDAANRICRVAGF